jgi:thiamine-phosphate pyrophosphorylase
MRRRQTVARQWLIIAGEEAVTAARRLSRGSGILLLGPLPSGEMRRLRQVARQRGLAIATEQRRATARVHDGRELRTALLAGTEMILLSPLYPTRSHPERKPLPRMRAAALARLAGRKLIALGGMNAGRYRKVAPLGFTGWAGISAFRT